MTKHDEEFRLSVVQQYLYGPGGYKTIAKRYEPDHEMFRRWVLRSQAHDIHGLKKKFTHYSAEFNLLVLQHMRDTTFVVQEF